jgi:RNA polymerase sigma-70 factor, ECF subfamily
MTTALAPTQRFDEWIAPEVDFVRRVSGQLTRTRADAEDLAQEALTRAYRGIGGFDGRYPKAWLRRIVANTAASNARRRRFDEVHLEHEPPVLGDQVGRVEQFRPDTVVIDATFDPTLDVAVTALSTDHRRVIELVDVGGLTYDEAAAELDVPVGTVMSRLHRARSKLRAALRGSHLDRAASAEAIAPV